MKSRKPRWYLVPKAKADRMKAAGFATKVDEKGRSWVLAMVRDLMAHNLENEHD